MTLKLIKTRAIIFPILMLMSMGIGFLLQNIGIITDCWGAIIPLTPEGLKGVFLSPLLHGNWEHLLGNSVPIAVLLFLLYYFYPIIANKVFFLGWILTGFMVWLLPPINIFTGEYNYTCVIGASGIVYVLAFFLFFSGLFKWNTKLLTISLLVALYYGSLVWGILPEELFKKMDKPSNISWQSHLAGALVGIIMAFLFKKIGDRKKKFIWEFNHYYSEKDDKLWQEYKENHPEDFQELPQKKNDDIWSHLDELRRKK